MAKELPYYKHEPSEWLEGEIQICSDSAIVCFKNLCSGYWLKLGCITYAFALNKYCRKETIIIQELIDSGVIDVLDDNIQIKFLDKQFKELNIISEKRKNAANERWKNANALQMESKSNAIREEEIRRDKTKKENKSLEIRKIHFYESLKHFVEIYPKEMIRDFYDYWSEANKTKTKMKYELQKTFEISLRLKTWAKRDKNFTPNQTEGKVTFNRNKLNL